MNSDTVDMMAYCVQFLYACKQNLGQNIHMQKKNHLSPAKKTALLLIKKKKTLITIFKQILFIYIIPNAQYY